MFFLLSYLPPTADEKAPLQPHPKLSAWIGGSYYLQETHPAIQSQTGTNGRINEHCFGWMLEASCLGRTKGCNCSSEGLAAPCLCIKTGRTLRTKVARSPLGSEKKLTLTNREISTPPWHPAALVLCPCERLVERDRHCLAFSTLDMPRQIR